MLMVMLDEAVVREVVAVIIMVDYQLPVKELPVKEIMVVVLYLQL